MFKFKITKFLEKVENGEGLSFDMGGILKETKEEIFNPQGEKKALYISRTPGGGDSTPLVSTGKFKRSLYVSGTGIKSSDNKSKIQQLKERYGVKYFKPSFKEIMKYIKINTK
jgi:hypothetical protein